MIRRLLALVSVVVVALVVAAPSAGASDFGFTGSGTAYGDYGTGHGAAGWGENIHEMSYCFDSSMPTSPSSWRDDLAFGVEAVIDVPSGINAPVAESCDSHTDIVFISSNLPGEGDRRFTPVGGGFGVADQWWVELDLYQLAINAANGTEDCNGGASGDGRLQWLTRYSGGLGAGHAFGLHFDTSNNDVMDTPALAMCSWLIYTISSHNQSHIADWNA